MEEIVQTPNQLFIVLVIVNGPVRLVRPMSTNVSMVITFVIMEERASTPEEAINAVVHPVGQGVRAQMISMNVKLSKVFANMEHVAIHTAVITARVQWDGQAETALTMLTNAQTHIYAIMGVVLTLREVIAAHALRDGPIQTVTKMLMNATLTQNYAITDHVPTLQAVIVVIVIMDILGTIVKQRSTTVSRPLAKITERVPRAHVDLPVNVEHLGLVIHATYTTIVTAHLAKTKEHAAVQTVHLHATV